MTYRGDDEPEYIDDDEYCDPDERAGGRKGGRRRSNVLGGSFRAGGDEPTGGRGKPPARDAMPKGTSRGGRRTRPGRSKAADDRRARLAGTGSHKKREAPPRSQTDKPREAEKSDGGGRLAGLRGRLPGGKAADAKTDAKADAKPDGRGNKAAAIARGLRGHFSGRRQRGQTGPSESSVSRAGQGARSQQQDTRPAGRRASQAQAAPPARSAADKRPKLNSSEWLDLDRKLDLAGVGLVFGAIALFFSALSQEHAAIGAVHNFIGQLLGWGAAAAPMAMFAVGMWLIVRHFGEKAPVIDPIRLVGAALVFVGLLTFFQYLDSFGYTAAIPDAMQAQQVECAARTTGRNGCAQEMSRLAECQMAVTSGCLQELVQYAYQRSQGGGYVGGWLYLTLVNNFTEIGGFVVMVMVLTFGMMMTTRQSMAEIAVACVGIGRSFRSWMAQRAAKIRARRLQAEQRPAQTAPLRAAKPPPAQLPGLNPAARALPEPAARALPEPAARALPEPAADSKMPIPPIRIDERELLSRRGRRSFASAEPDQESALAANQQHSGVFGRLFGRGKSKAAPPQARDQGNAAAGGIGLMGRILNRAESKPTAQTSPAPPPVPRQSQPSLSSNRPPLSSSQPPSPPSQPSSPPKQPSSPPSQPSSPPKQPPSPKKPTSSGPISSRPRVPWELPDYRSLLASGSAKELDHEHLLNQAKVIEETLASFGAPGRVVEVNTGPVITQFAVEPDYLTTRAGKKNRVKVSAISQLDKDLQLALGAKSIRVEAPVPGKGYVGIEVPNPGSALVSLRDVMESESFREIKSPLAVALGMSVDGTPISGDLTRMPHLLIAGTTGSGKSVCVNAIINSILATNSPETVKFIMVDPKRVELTGYNGLPHLIAPVVVELERIVGVLKWVTREMDERYKKFSGIGARNIIDYNENGGDGEAMPYIVVIIDELADLMMLAPEETERTITRIAALARATGIHLIIATQRPSVDVVTGLIKANFPARIAFAVAGSVDSRVILDQPGAERLLGTGDMLYLSGESPAPLRLQGVFVSDEEINSISRYWKTQHLGIETPKPISIESESTAPTAASSPAVSDADPNGQTSFWDVSAAPRDMTGMAVEGKTGNPDPQEDELYQTAVDMVRRLDKASISLLQRRLRIGYTRAARLVDMMEERGVVGPAKEGSSKPRDVIAE